ncbi:MAG TPA: DUF5074 domain-containing protein [Thermoanaerobaculia bacterium]|jgi:YVTN family beta-propeller protein|nr:DUF5074 domain-containing protein [Thermoanaerobaculia bacterium]
MRGTKILQTCLLACLLALGLGAAAARAQVVDEGYVAISGSTRVDVLDPSTNTFTSSIGGTGSRNLSLSSDGHLLFSAGSNSVQVIDTQTKSVLASVPAGNIVTGVVQAANGFIYDCNNNLGTVSVIDPATYTVVSTLPIFCGAITATPDGSAVWANSLTFPPLAIVMAVIDPATNTFTTFPLGGLFNVNAIAFTPDGAFAYLAVNDGSGGRVLVIDTATHAQVAVIPVGTFPGAATISPDGSFVYVANITTANVSVIDTATNTVVATVPVGSFPRAIAFTADGASAYVTNGNSNSISVIDTATLTVTSTFGTGSRPWGIVFQQDSDHDGVLNNHDNCPGTPAGETVDANGCSISQLCPCAGSWKNHGKYVSCVAHTSESFVNAGLITEAQKDALVSAAGRSSCGK